MSGRFAGHLGHLFRLSGQTRSSAQHSPRASGQGWSGKPACDRTLRRSDSQQHHATGHTQRRSRSGVGWPPCCNLPVRLPLKDNHNLFVALREAFPADLDAVAIESADGGPRLHLARPRARHRDARQPARLARPAAGEPRSPCRPRSRSRRCCSTSRCCAPATSTCRSTPPTRATRSSTSSATPSRRSSSARRKDFGWVIARSPSRPARAHVFTLGDDRSGSLLERAAHFGDQPRAGARKQPTTSRRSSTRAAPPGAARARC